VLQFQNYKEESYKPFLKFPLTYKRQTVGGSDPNEYMGSLEQVAYRLQSYFSQGQGGIILIHPQPYFGPDLEIRLIDGSLI